MHRTHRVEQYYVFPVPHNTHGNAFESNTYSSPYHRDDRHATDNHHEYYVPTVEKITIPHGTTNAHLRPSFYEKQRAHWPGTKDHHKPIERENHGQHPTGDYLDYVSRLEHLPSAFVEAPHVQNQHAMQQDKKVMYEEYVTSDEEYDSDAHEMVKMKVITRVEKRAVNW